MTTQIQTKCPHLKRLPLDKPPEPKGVITPPCLHPAPHYFLGWTIDIDKVHKAYPDYHGTSLSNFWQARVIEPWRKYAGVFVTESGFALRPGYTNLLEDGKPHYIVYLTSNYDAGDLNAWKNEEYIRRAKEVVFTDEVKMGQLQWIRKR
ncbi:hypothetical protein BDP27DRAFT_1365282 [Rhodocollybia butyracea]|uniref:Uncharacterized protein n=1 Tax=Rhodocollybia butyracea TaxID=206335 RepID=A0A9P5U5Q3_9AGAR|nr:hypothetical protein BDP27DRAFT_1365282 [Rhodocollybia butyracea]